MKAKGRLKNVSIAFETHKLILSFEIDGEPGDIEKYFNTDLDISFDKRRKKRSLDANACLWGCLGRIAEENGTDNWTEYLRSLRSYGKYTYINIKPEAVEDLRRQWREIDVVGDAFVIDEITGEISKMKQVLCFYGSSTYNSKEFSRLLDGVISDMKDLGLETPASEELRAMISEMEKKENDKRN